MVLWAEADSGTEAGVLSAYVAQTLITAMAIMVTPKMDNLFFFLIKNVHFDVLVLRQWTHNIIQALRKSLFPLHL